jgi:hypothetical protein
MQEKWKFPVAGKTHHIARPQITTSRAHDSKTKLKNPRARMTFVSAIAQERAEATLRFITRMGTHPTRIVLAKLQAQFARAART